MYVKTIYQLVVQICTFSEKGRAKSRNQHIHVDPRFCFEFGEAMCVDKKNTIEKENINTFYRRIQPP